MHEKARFFLVCMFPFSVCQLDFTAQLFFSKAVLKIFAKTYFENRFFKKHRRRPYARQRVYSPPPQRVSIPHIPQTKFPNPSSSPPFFSFFEIFQVPPTLEVWVACPAPASDSELFAFAFCKGFQLPFLSHFASLCSSWTDWQKFFAGRI